MKVNITKVQFKLVKLKKKNNQFKLIKISLKIKANNWQNQHQIWINNYKTLLHKIQ
jgi:hypothetical protein